MNYHAGSWRFSLLLWIVTVLSVNAFGHANSRKLVLNPQRCRILSETQKDWLTAEWQPFLEHTRVCTVRNSKNETIVFLISVYADLYYKAQSGNPVPQIRMPNPLLFLPSGDDAGSLPYNFPDDPPAELRVTFTDWNQDFPQRIDLYLTDPRAAGDRSLPSLRWDKSQKKYLATEVVHD